VEDTRRQREQAAKYLAAYPEVIRERRERRAVFEYSPHDELGDSLNSLWEWVDGLDEMVDALAAGVQSLTARIDQLEREIEQSA
jgi:hypothetical protein